MTAKHINTGALGAQQQYVVINQDKPKRRRPNKPRKLRNPFYQRTYDGQPAFVKGVEQWHIPRNPDDRLYSLIEKSIQQNAEMAKNAHAKPEPMQEQQVKQKTTGKEVEMNENPPKRVKRMPDRVERDRRLSEFYKHQSTPNIFQVILILKIKTMI